MAGPVIRVKGYRECARALNVVNRDAKKVLFAGLRSAAEPIAVDTRGRLSKYQGISLGTIKPAARIKGVAIVQRAKKVTGLRPDFGALQMRKGLIPAVQEAEPDIYDRVEAAFEALIREEKLQA